MNNIARQILTEQIKKYGTSILDDPRRLEGILRDLCGDCRGEISILIGAVKERVAAELVSAPENTMSDILNDRLVKRLQDHLMVTEEAATWAVESWTEALGKKVLSGNANLESEKQEHVTEGNNTKRIKPVGKATFFILPSVIMGVILLLAIIYFYCGGEYFVESATMQFTHSRGIYKILHPKNDKGASFVVFSPDGTVLASGNNRETISLWDTDTWRESRNIKTHSDMVGPIAFSPDGRILAAETYDSVHEFIDSGIELWDVATGKRIRILKTEQKVTSMAFSPDGKTLVAGSLDFTTKLWDVYTGREIWVNGEPENERILKNSEDVNAVAFSPDGRVLISGLNNGVIKHININSGKDIAIQLDEEDNNICSLAFSPHGVMFITGESDGCIEFWEGIALSNEDIFYSYKSIKPQEPIKPGYVTGVKLAYVNRKLKVHKGSVSSIAFSPSGRKLVTASESDKIIKLWELDSKTLIQTFRGHKGTINNVVFSPDGKMMASSASDGIKIWKL